MSKERVSYLAHLSITVLCALALLYLFFKYVFVITLPFLLAWGVAAAVRPLAKKISDGLGMPIRLVGVVLTSFIIIAIISATVGAVIYAGSEAWRFLTSLAEGDTLYKVLDKVLNPISGMLGEGEGVAELEAHIGDAINSMLSSLLSALVSVLGAFVRSVPKFLIFILISVIAAVYFSLDLEKVNRFVKKHLPKKAREHLTSLKNRFFQSILKYLRAYLILMAVTFFIMLFGFLCLKVKYAVLFAFIVALLDALPLIGVGTVIVPWSIYQLIFADTGLGIGLMVLFVLHQVIRQFIEPRIVGKNLGIHPIVSLILLYAGYILFGFFGLILIPILSVLINILFNKNDPAEIA